ncbi:hypothetical protein A2U01_0006359 [Trifolium medium]|uniref:Uncharacterized protein n=1 Tax=Trifolium medium TaxID=97028 RepID=A0A392MEC7_9FABA|nr:hypothetical protein [Trifolium medium]
MCLARRDDLSSAVGLLTCGPLTATLAGRDKASLLAESRWISPIVHCHSDLSRRFSPSVARRDPKIPKPCFFAKNASRGS